MVRRVNRKYRAAFINKRGETSVTLKDVEGFGDEFSDDVIGYYSPRVSGFLDSCGEKVVNGDFSAVGAMSYGAAPVKVGTTWGLIGRDGTWLCKPRFARLHQQYGPFFVFRQDLSPQSVVVLNQGGNIIWKPPPE